MDDIRIVAVYCRNVLNLKEARLSDPYFYQSLSLCVIDAVFSIRAIYETTTMPTVKRYCDYFNLKRYRTDRASLPKIEEQQSIKDWLSAMESKGIEFFTSSVFKNRQRTSSKNGILKPEASLDLHWSWNDTRFIISRICIISWRMIDLKKP